MQDASQPNGDVVVTTSDFVRRFGTWQEHAARAPVYILHRGRPRFVMTSVETMQQLCARRDADPAPDSPADAALLDLVADIILILDRDWRVLQSSAPARRYFNGAAPGTPIDQLVDKAGAALVVATLRRVAASGLAETVEAAAPYAGRQLSWAIVPHPAGVAMAARDVTVVEELAAARAVERAVAAAIGITGHAAVVLLNLRGHIATAADAFAALADVPPAALAGLRFSSLIERDTRLAVADALDAVLADGIARAVECQLLVGGQQPRPVTIGFAAIRQGAPIEGLAAFVVDAGLCRQP